MHRITAFSIVLIVLLLCISVQAEQFSVYPDTAGVSATIFRTNDTVEIHLTNLNTTPITGLVLTDFDDSIVTLIDCTVDGLVQTEIFHEWEDGSVYVGKVSNRFVFDGFDDDFVIRYHVYGVNNRFIEWSGMKTFPLFGLLTNPDSCCVGMTGNVNYDPEHHVDISDLTVLVAHLFTTFEPLICPAEANTSGDLAGAIDISDLTALVDFLFLTFTEPADCQ